MDKELFEIIINKQTDIILLTDIKQRTIIYANEELERFYGSSFEEFKSQNNCICNTFLKQEDYLFNTMEDGSYWLEYIQQNPHKTHKALIQDKDGYFQHFKVYIKKIKKDLYLVILNNITNIISIQEELLKERTFLREYKKIVDISTILTKTDTNGVITYANDKFCEISQYTKEELIGKPHNVIRHPENPKEMFENMWFTIKSGGIWSGTLKNRKKDGGTYYVHATVAPIFDKDGNIKEYIGIRKDITKEFILREELEAKNKKIQLQNEELKRKALLDSLTDSYNRRGLDEIMKEVFEKHKNGEKNDICIIMTDIDKFKIINDTYGHDVGDNILTEFVVVLKENLKHKDIIARYGGEEFLIIAQNIDKESVIRLAENLRKQIEKTNFSNDLKITASFGIAAINELEPGKSIDECIKNFTKIADNRLYDAKKQGRNRVVFD